MQKSISLRAFYPLLLLLLPLIGNEVSSEFDWSFFDFIVMGALLLGLGLGVDLVLKSYAPSTKRAFYIILLVVIFLTVWVELAVGLFGNVIEGAQHGVDNTFPDPLTAGWKGYSVCEVIEDNESVRTLKCTFAPGVGHERHFHAAHFGYTLSGSKFRITDTTGTREVNVPTGYSFFNDTIEWHEVLNIGQDTAVFLIVEPKKKHKE